MRAGRLWCTKAAAVVLGVSTAGWAQSRLPGMERLPPEIEELNVQAEAGLSGYTGLLGATSAVGPLWGVTVGGRAWNLVGLEVGYEGTRNGIRDARVPDEQAIFRHNASAFGKVGPTVAQNFHPFVGAGLGLSYVNVTDGADGPYRNDFLQEIPLGAGVEYVTGPLTAGVRTTYRVLINDEFAELTPSLDNPSGGLVSAAVTLGGRF